MNDFAVSPAEHDEPLYEVLSAYLDSVAEGCAPPLPELVKRHPQFAADLQRFFDNRRHFAELTEPLIAVTLRAHETVRFESADPNAATPSGAHTATGSADFKPRDFGDYELVAQIASGGMGVVYKARQKSLNRIVALKRIRSAQLADDLEVQRFRSEAEAAAQLDHPSIVPIYEIGAVDGEQFFSMKLIEGSSLDRQ
ncbi:MAG TPA: protein kinase, partial [Gemmataceae bacterium]|nr:protein kinase [Gemmataceae bacterium]